MDGMDELKTLHGEFVHLARLALAGRPQDVQLHVHRLAKRVRATQPEFAESLAELLRESPSRSSPLRREAVASVPVDLDTRLQLVRVEASPQLDHEPSFPPQVREKLDQLLQEHRSRNQLVEAGLAPTRTALFTGQPGVGKTLAARWVALKLNRPLLTLDLSAVMSSFLGRTGTNLRHVLDYAKGFECVLLLDELDAVAKRRDDSTEVGELKRLVTVLLQEVDDWPPPGILIAATNHPDLIDPAAWRRFELTVQFPLPDVATLAEAIATLLGNLAQGANAKLWSSVLAAAFEGASFSDLERELLRARRSATVGAASPDEALLTAVQTRMATLKRPTRTRIASSLVASNVLSQHRAYEITGVSRDTIRKTIGSTGTLSGKNKKE